MKIRKMLLVMGLAGLIAPNLVSAAPTPQTPEELQNEINDQGERIRKLEDAMQAVQNTLFELQRQIEERDQLAAPGADPLVGTWNCSDGAFDYDVTFSADGQVFQQEPTLGNVRNNRWSRVNDSEIAIGGGSTFRISFSSPDSVQVESAKNKKRWDCSRK